jgi:hypothetical protein
VALARGADRSQVRALVAVILFCVMRPVIVVPSVIPQSSYAARVNANDALNDR